MLDIFENMIENLTFYSFHVFFRIYLEMFANGIGISNPWCLFEPRHGGRRHRILEVLARFSELQGC